MNSSKMARKKLFYSLTGEFVSGMANVGNLWGVGLDIELPRSSSTSAWQDVSKSFKSAGNDLRWAIRAIDSNE